MKRGVWPRRLISGLVVLLLLAVLGSAWFSHRLLVEMLSGRAFATAPQGGGDPLTLGYRGDPMQAFGLPFETLMVKTALGPAPAWYVPGTPGVTRAAVFVHGIGGTREDGYLYLPELHATGLPVLLISYRNDPGAPLAPDGLRSFGLTEWTDLEAAIALLDARGIDRVVLVAASMGGGIAGQFLARSDSADLVDALVLDAPALDAPAILRHVTDRLGLPLRELGVPLALPVFALTHGLNLSQARVTEVLARFEGPILLFHGTRDRIVPPATSLALLEARQGQTTVLLTPGDHLQSRATAPERFHSLLADFLAALPG